MYAGNKVSPQCWADSVSSLADSKFFDIMRLYLGEIETPYNKQRLIEQLAGFIKNPVNSDNMLALLDEYDIKLLTALDIIKNPTQESIIQFFSQDFSTAEIVTEISNLIARLLVFEEKDKYSQKKYLRINPYIYDKLKKQLVLSNIVAPAVVKKQSLEDVFTISPDFISAFISFINTKGCSCKSDGVMKKNAQAKATALFPGKEKAVQLLLTAFINLNLVHEGDKAFEIDRGRLELFSELSEPQQYAFICAASCSRFGREGLKKEAQLLLDTLCAIPESGSTLADIVRLGFLAGSIGEEEQVVTKSRFSRMLEAARQEDGILPEQSGALIDRMLDSAVEFGLLIKAGYDEKGKEIFVQAPVMAAGVEKNSESPVPKNLINIDSTFTVSIMPGLSLNKLLPLMDFLEIKSFGVVCEFEITKKSVSIAFDCGWNADSLCSTLEKYINYELPQNLKINIFEWYDSYSSAMIYKGYVLKVKKNNIALVENNPRISSCIKEKLAEGIYLLNIPLDTDISSFVEESGLDFMGSVKNPHVSGERLAFPVLHKGSAVLRQAQEPQGNHGVAGPVKVDFSAAGHLLSSLKEALKKMELTKNQRESLENRIHNRLILTKEQLVATSVRSEILEADGMDFGGKLHLFEAGLKENDMMEITLPQFDDETKYFKIIGHTLGITKQTGDAVVRFEVYPGGEITNFVVSRITYLRRLRF